MRRTTAVILIAAMAIIGWFSTCLSSPISATESEPEDHVFVTLSTSDNFLIATNDEKCKDMVIAEDISADQKATLSFRIEKELYIENAKYAVKIPSQVAFAEEDLDPAYAIPNDSLLEGGVYERNGEFFFEFGFKREIEDEETVSFDCVFDGSDGDYEKLDFGAVGVVDVVADISQEQDGDDKTEDSASEENVGDEGKSDPVAEDKAVNDDSEEKPDRSSSATAMTLSTQVETFDGETYDITAAFDDHAGVGDTAELTASEIPEGSSEYEEAISKITAELSDENRLAVIEDAKVFDISVVEKGEEIEPASSAFVTVASEDSILEDDATLEVAHFADEVPEILDVSPSRDGGSAIEFSTNSFSTFAFVESKYIGTLDGQSFVVAIDNQGTTAGGLTGLTSEIHPSYSDRLQGIWMNILNDGELTAVTERDGTVASDADITVWTFEHVKDNLYYLRADTGQYLGKSGNKLVMLDDPYLLKIELVPKGDKDGMYSGKIFILDPDSSKRINLKNGNAAMGFAWSTSKDANSKFSLFAPPDLDPQPATVARKIKSSDVEGGQDVVIYRRVYDEATGEYELYVVDGNGDLVYAYDNGDTVGYRHPVSTTWHVIQYFYSDGTPNGYFDFYNEETQTFLAPTSTGTISGTKLGVRLAGMAEDRGPSTIEGWDTGAWAYYGLALDLGNRTIVQKAAPSDEFSFAVPEDRSTLELREVDTVDSAANGVTIKMYDFPDRPTMNIVGNDTFYDKGTFKQGLVQDKLGSDGLPISTTGNSFSALYNDGYYRGEANHLFLQSVYDQTGYYEFNSFQNYALYNVPADQSTGDFTVYDNLGTPKNGSGGSPSSYYRGNFMPYNEISLDNLATNTRIYDNRTDFTSLENPEFDETMFMANRPSSDYYFGMSIETEFFQRKDGLDQFGNPTLYEFYGDDDLWVFVDGVLVLDIGGIHSAVAGSIDFSTGVVKAGDLTPTTIKQCFEDAGVFPDGTPWDPDLVDEYFDGDTLMDYSTHVFKMFYQERGSGASTLEVRFNVSPIESGTFTVEKELLETDQEEYTEARFAYQAFVRDQNGQAQLLEPGMILDDQGNVVAEEDASDDQKANRVRVTYEGGGSVEFEDDVVLDGNTYDSVFYLKPGEKASFSGIPARANYYVSELCVDGNYYKQVKINEVDASGTIPEGLSVTVTSSEKTILQRFYVLFSNIPAQPNLNQLRITKQVRDHIDDGASFEFRVFLEGQDGTLASYSQGQYYVTKEVEGQEHYFSFSGGVLTDRGTDPVVCSTSGAYGTIAGIPDGYTVVIDKVLADTDFKVLEINNPDGYLEESKVVEAGTYSAADIADADGKIKRDTDAHVIFTNGRYSVITAEKEWSGDRRVISHGDVKVALYKYEGSTVVLAENDVVETDLVQTITPSGGKAMWYLNVDSEEELGQYFVREVEVSEESGQEVIEPVDESGSITITGESVAGVSGFVSNVYTVSYETGEAIQVDSEHDVYDREDVVTNTLPPSVKSVMFVKVDSRSDSLVLPDAVFMLSEVEGGEVVDGTEVELTSDSQGRLSDGIDHVFTFDTGFDYQLSEITPPEGYFALDGNVEIKISTDGVTYVQSDYMDGTTQVASLKYPTSPASSANPYVVYIRDECAFELPRTGGLQLAMLVLCGLALVAGGVFTAWRNTREE